MEGFEYPKLTPLDDIKEITYNNNDVCHLNPVTENNDNNYGYFCTMNYNKDLDFDEKNYSNDTIMDLYPNSLSSENNEEPGIDQPEENEQDNNLQNNNDKTTESEKNENNENASEKNSLNCNEINNNPKQAKTKKRKKKYFKTSTQKIEITAKEISKLALIEKRLNYKPPKVKPKTLKQNLNTINFTTINKSLKENQIIRSSSDTKVNTITSPLKLIKYPKLKPITHETYLAQQLNKKEIYEQHLIKIRKQFAEKKYLTPEAKKFQYVIIPGNASYLIKRCFNHRSNWKESESLVSSIFNFKWQQLNFKNEFRNLSKIESIPQIINHFEFNMDIANKSNLFSTLFSYCEYNHINIFKYVPFTILINQNNQNEHKFKDVFLNIEKYITNYSNISSLKLNKVNNNDYKDTSYNHFFYVPNQYFHLKSKPKSEYYIETGCKTNLVIPHTHYNGKNLWIIKASNLNRGQCIRVVDSLDKAHEIIQTFQEGITLQGKNKDKEENNIQINSMAGNASHIPPNYVFKTDKIIIQKYIERPFLYKNRKCDMRIWVLLTHDLKVYVFKEGHLKTCSANFDINNNKDAFIHITNYSYQKHCADFQKFEKGNEVSFHDFQKELDLNYAEKKINVYKDIMDKVKEIIKLTMMSVKKRINANNRQYCFEIFGYDFMMDEEFNMFLIEINMNPGIEESSPWIKAIVPRMLDDALRLTVDKVFNTKYEFNEDVKKITIEECSNEIKGNKDIVEIIRDKEVDEIGNESIHKETQTKDNKHKVYNYNSPFPVPGYEPGENLWDLVCDLQNIDKTQSFTGIKHLISKRKQTEQTN